MSEEQQPVAPSRGRVLGRRVALGCGGLTALLLLTLALLLLVEREPRPQGQAGPEAEARVARIEAAIDLPAWKRTGAVAWTFSGRHEHLWDRKRGLARVRWSGYEVLVDLARQSGRAWQAGRRVTEPEQNAALVKRAYAYWCNDSFWLNPLAKLRDPGTTREALMVGSAQGLVVRYASGGVTPGDTYLWVLGPDDLPTRWKMWVSIVPIGGLDATWEEWTTLATGARVATLHRAVGLPLVRLTNLKAAARLSELEPGPDPFAPLEAQ